MNKYLSSFFLSILFFLLIIPSTLAMPVSQLNQVLATDQSTKYSYLPVIFNRFAETYSTNKKFIGIYMAQYWTDDTVATYMPMADNLAAKKHTVSAWFISLQNIAFTNRQTDNRTNNFYRQLEALWKKGYISFVNLQSAASVNGYEVTDNCPIPFNADQVASGSCDKAIEKMATLYAQWIALGGGRRAFLAPLQEMNGDWVPYGQTPDNFKQAFQRIQNIFSQKGVTRDQVWWVFAPNGWSDDGHEFINYYPGNDLVDVVAFSSYNFGYCWFNAPWYRWENADTLYEPYIKSFQTIAPKKPIIISQTGTTSLTANGASNIQKNQWLESNYQWLSTSPAVLGVLYFDIPKECDWGITTPDETFKSGYKSGAAGYQYLTAQDLQALIK